LFPPAPVAIGEGRHLGHNGLIEHEEDRPWAPARSLQHPDVPCGLHVCWMRGAA
jgi:hypothetical protein